MPGVFFLASSDDSGEKFTKETKILHHRKNALIHGP